MYMTLRINRATTDAYRCLCRDLGAEYKVEELDLTRLAELRSELLKYTEKWTRNTDTDDYSSMLTRHHCWDADWREISVQYQQIKIEYQRGGRKPDYMAYDQFGEAVSLVDGINSLFDFKQGFLDYRFAHNPKAFGLVYQLLSAPLKIRSAEVTDTQKKQYYERLLENEESCATYTMDRSNPVHRIARQLSLLASTDLRLDWTSVQCNLRDGPGAVYDRSILDAKRQVKRLSTDYLSVYPFETWFANANLCFEMMDEVEVTDESDACRLTLVPKDYKGPRGVFISPKESMKIQLSQMELLVRAMTKSWMRYSYDPKSQAHNQMCAHVGSYTGYYSTLDLSDASDRIPCDLVAWLFPEHLYNALSSVRARYLQIESLKLPMRMFAPMGDGRTFPILTWTCACYATAAVVFARYPDVAYRKIRSSELRECAEMVRVFGDDIAVVNEYTGSVIHALEACNLKVNIAKSYRLGSFRESCGVDAHKGHDVTPFRMRVALDRETDLASLIASHNNAWRRGYRLYAGHLESYIQTRYGHSVAYTSNSICNPNMLLSQEARRKNLRLKTRISDLHNLEVQAVVPKLLKQGALTIDARWHLNDWLLRANQRELVTEMSWIRGGMQGDVDRNNDTARKPASFRRAWVTPTYSR